MARLRCDHTTKHGIKKKKDTTTYQQPNFLFEMINIVYIKNQTLVFQFNKVTKTIKRVSLYYCSYFYCHLNEA